MRGHDQYMLGFLTKCFIYLPINKLQWKIQLPFSKRLYSLQGSYQWAMFILDDCDYDLIFLGHLCSHLCWWIRGKLLATVSFWTSPEIVINYTKCTRLWVEEALRARPEDEVYELPQKYLKTSSDLTFSSFRNHTCYTKENLPLPSHSNKVMIFEVFKLIFRVKQEKNYGINLMDLFS